MNELEHSPTKEVARIVGACVLLFALLVGVISIVASNAARATPGGALLVAQATPASIGFVDSFAHSCTTTASLIPLSTLGTAVSYSCQTPASGETAGTVLVGVGDSGLGDPAYATRTSPVYSGDTIREWGGNVRSEYCRSDTGTVVIFCRALISATSAP